MRCLIYLLFLLCSCYKTFCQAPDIEWSLCIGGSSWDIAYTVVQAPDSGFIVGGDRGTSNGDWSECGFERWVFLVKLDSTGNIVWKKCYGGSEGGEAIYSIKATTYGGYIFTANTWSNDGDVSGNHGNSDYWVVKIDEEGNIEWQKCYGGTDTEYPSEIIQTADGGYAVTGYSRSNDGDVSGYHGGQDFWVVKIDSAGNLEWQKCLGGSDVDEGEAIAQTPDGGYICTGFTNSDDGDVSDFPVYWDYWIVKLDSEGDILWEKNFGGSNSDDSYSNLVDGSVLMAGTTNSDDGDVTDSYAGDAWTVKVDSAGNLIRAKCYGGSSGAGELSSVLTDEYDYLFSGWSALIEGGFTKSFWILKTDSAGIIKWQKHFGGSENETSYDALPTYDGGTIAVGYTASTDGDVSGNHGELDVWVVKLGKGCEQEKYYTDADSDGYGNMETYIYSCTDTAGYADNNLDCNDLDSLIHPGIPVDYCNAIDDNCNSEIDEDAVFVLYYADADGDSYGDVSTDSLACSLLAGYVTESTDCNDADATIQPGAKEVCNFLDDNCNGETDEGITYLLLYVDADGDTYGDANSDTLFCDITEGYTTDSTDCDDANPAIYPGAPELLNGIDDNCDGKIDVGVGIDDPDLHQDDNAFAVYPNPTDGNIFITSSLTNYTNTTLEVSTLPGEKIVSILLTSAEQIIDVSELAAGNYIISIKQDDVLLHSEQLTLVK
ncbi:MAG: MopE-related protein [Chitinophagales bacterium]